MAQATKSSRKDLGYAGKKDTHAIATQWISLPETAVVEEGVIDGSLDVLRLTRNQRKLKLGNSRVIVFNSGSLARNGEFWERIQLIAQGVPNYFGPQRLAAQDQTSRQHDACPGIPERPATTSSKG